MVSEQPLGQFGKEMVTAVVADIHRLIGEDYVVDAIEKTFDFIRDFTSRSPDHKALTRSALKLSARHARFQKARRHRLPEPESRDQLVSDLIELVEQVESVAKVPVPDIEAPEAEALSGDVNAKLAEAQHEAGYDADQLRRILLQESRRRSPEQRVVARLESIERSYARGGFNLGPVSCELIAGEITGVVGMNASGKTTMLRVLLGELSPSAGQVSFPALGARRWPRIKSQLAYVAQLPEPWSGRMRTNLNFTAAAYGLTGRANEDLVDLFLHRYGLKPYENARWDEISGGFKIRFELVRALLMRPRLLVLDEPLAYLDIVSQQLFLDDLRSIARSVEHPIPIVITSQHLYEIESIADRMIILDTGTVIYSGPLGELPSNQEFDMFEVEVKATKSTILEKLRPAGLVDLEPTTLGWILIFRKPENPGVVQRALIEGFGQDLRYFRDISHSTRVLFRGHRDALERPVDLRGGAA